jgi:aspartate carbamoyltransferase
MTLAATPVIQQPKDYVQSYQPRPIQGDFVGKHIVSVDQFTREDLQIIFDAVRSIKKRLHQQDRGLVEVCSGKVMATLFYESSTRTDLSFQAAMRRLGGEVISASNGIRFSSVYKGEDLADTVRAAGCYADVIVLRHPEVGASFEAAHYLDMLRDKIERQPVLISAGDGIGEHPSQALLDMFTVVELKGQLDGLSITLVGDLKHGRTVHSLARLVARLEGQDVTIHCVSPPALRMPDDILARLRAKGISVTETDDLYNVLGKSDVIYWTRVQEERFDDPAEYESIKDGFIMTPPVLAQAKADAILMHPLPRKHEMGTQADHDILDADPRSVYFQQMENGMYVRMALLTKVLRGVHV